jgi:uncharacterized protein (DUF433 family)
MMILSEAQEDLMVWQEHIHIDSDIMFGKPVVKGTRIPIYMILELVEAGFTIQQIITDYYPSLSEEDVRACIQYATHLVKNEEIHFAQPPLTPVTG